MSEVIYYLQYSSASIFPPGSWLTEHCYYGEDMEQMESDAKSKAKKYPNRSWRIFKCEKIVRQTTIFEIPMKETGKEDAE